MKSAEVPSIIQIELGGDRNSCEYTVSSPTNPLYTWTSGNCPIKLCGPGKDEDHDDVDKMVLDPSSHLQGIWSALLDSGHFLFAQFEKGGMIRLWSGGSTAPVDVQVMLVKIAPQYLPAGTRVELVTGGHAPT